MTSSIAAAAFAAGLVLSPESLTLIGHVAGHGGFSFAAALPLAVVVTLFTARQLAAFLDKSGGKRHESLTIRPALMEFGVLFFGFAPRLFAAVCMSATLVVTGGFVFNEVFVRSFPNFAFAFCLLGFLTAINLAQPRVAAAVQTLFAAAVVTGLAALIVAWFVSAPQTATASDNAAASNFGYLSLILLLFVGFDLGFFTPGAAADCRERLQGIAFAVVAAGALYLAWGTVCLLSVPRDALVDSTVPHMRVAQSIIGQEGRLIMGIVVIAGVCGGVNALLSGVGGMASLLVRQGLLPNRLALSPWRHLVPVLLISGGASILMVLGYVGEPAIESAIKAAILFWLFSYGTLHVVALISRREAGHNSPAGREAGVMALSVVSIIVLAGASTCLLLLDERQTETLRFMGAFCAVAVVLFFIGLSLKKMVSRGF